MEHPAGIPGVLGIHHVAFAVTDLDAAIEFWTRTFGATLELRAIVADQGVEAASLEWSGAAGGPMGFAHGTLLELIAPHGGDSGVARFLERRGDGMHHVAWAVESVADALDALARAGARLIDTHARIGLHGVPVAFVHPSATGGVLVELVEVPGA